MRNRGHRDFKSLRSMIQDMNLDQAYDLRQSGSASRLPNGGEAVRVTEMWHGREIIGTGMEVEKVGNSFTGALYGEVASGISDDISDPNACEVSLSEAVAKAAELEGRDPNDERISEKSGKAVVWVDPETSVASLAYIVEFLYESLTEDPPVVSRPTYYLNACTMETILSFDSIYNSTFNVLAREARERRQTDDQCETDAPTVFPTLPPTNPPWSPSTAPPTNPPTQPPTLAPGECSNIAVGRGGNQKTGEVTYGAGGLCLNDLQISNNGQLCRMNTDNIYVVDQEGSTSQSIRTPVSFVCSEGYSDAVNGAYGVANDAFYYGASTFNMYQQKYRYRPLSWKPKIAVHYSRDYENAFWNGRDMYYGDGRSFFYPLVSNDVVAHELGHGVTSSNSNLIYRGESGGINEAFSDASGEAAEAFGAGRNDWMVGFQLRKTANAALRYFEDPTRDGRSIKSYNDYYDGLGVHFSSGVFNRAFYNMVQVQGMNLFDAYGCLLHANRFLWNQNTNMQQGACNVMQACQAIGLGDDIPKVRAAYTLVDIDVSNCDLSALAPSLMAGETRNSVEVSKKLKPIFEVEGRRVWIRATAADNTTVSVTVGMNVSLDTWPITIYFREFL